MDRLRSDWAVKTIVVLIVASILIRCVSATNLTVGGPAGWDGLLSDLQRWSSMTIFYTGDSLVFVYGPIHDVIEVNERAYNTCSINNPIRAYNDGESVVLLDRAGTRYFICGTRGHCKLGMRIQVDVLPRPEAPDDVGRNRRPQPPPIPLPPVIEMPSGPTTSASPPPQYGSATRAVAFADGTCFISGLLSSSILPLTMLLVLGFVHSYD